MCRFYYESIHFKKEGNIFELMDIVEYINEVLLVPSYIQSTRTYATRSGHSRKKRGEDTLSHTYYSMSESDGNCRKRYIDHPKGESKPLFYMAPGIHQTNARSWETLVLDMLKADQQSTAGPIPYK